jgi:hypothetical protein
VIEPSKGLTLAGVTCGAPWAHLVGIGRVTRQADTSQRQFNRAKLQTAHGADCAICIESTAVGVCITHRLQIPVHRLAHLSHSLSAAQHRARIGRAVGCQLAARH